MAKFNGHKNWNHWNVSLWINNDEGLYNIARSCATNICFKSMDERVQSFRDSMFAAGEHCTPDGAPYSKSAVRTALRDLMECAK